jgi:hypothetical protein
MKLFELITEAPLDAPENGPKPTKTKTSDDWDELFGQAAYNSTPRSVPAPKPKAEQPKPAPAPERKAMDPVPAGTTQARTANLRMDEPTANLHRQIDHNAPDTISNAQARASVDAGTPPASLANPTARLANPNPQENGNMPAVLGTAMAAAGEVVPEWHSVRNLPGYMASGIRAIGRQVFAAFTNTPIEDINVLAKLGAEGPNTLRELNAVASFVRDNGRRDTEAEIRFHDQIVGYTAEIQIFKAMGSTFMLVKDQAGNYIYSWPTTGGELNAPAANPRLR